MIDLPSLGLVDLVVLALVVVAAVGALRAGRGLLPVLGASLGTVALAWVAAVALTAWGPPPLAGEVQRSAFARALPMPVAALDDLGQLTGDRPGAPGTP
ncbi:hypothetical protein ENKNEFLB_02316 [Nocardioides aquaticus]|uniref:CvpA family protein n=1 Tax=Nocardioides aquaticus TaxID=160826 RepID=A0ABX8EHE2_9ACTN|nr:hypothetical protein [Nocardioides aquaticus]QVT79926.1 hypothetical protein ENKNEFLB_02316 [Nocardioides aquaticus]